MSKANTLPPIRLMHAPTVLLHRQPVLYTFPNSIWAAAAHLALFVLPRPSNVDRDELTYDVKLRGSAELEIDADFQVVDLAEGANFDPEFLKIVSKCQLQRLPFPASHRGPLSSEPKCLSPHPHPRGEIVYEHHRRDQLSRIYLIDSSPSSDLHHDGGARREGRPQLCIPCLSKDSRFSTQISNFVHLIARFLAK
jgi:hypothetical protein